MAAPPSPASGVHDQPLAGDAMEDAPRFPSAADRRLNDVVKVEFGLRDEPAFAGAIGYDWGADQDGCSGTTTCGEGDADGLRRTFERIESAD
jgi:hypothetical protein